MLKKIKKTLVINPWSLIGVYLPKERLLPVTIAIYDIQSDKAEIIEIIKGGK